MLRSRGHGSTRRGRPPNPIDPDASDAARLGAEIRARRTARGLTLAAMGELVGYTPQYVSEVERAKTTPAWPLWPRWTVRWTRMARFSACCRRSSRSASAKRQERDKDAAIDGHEQGRLPVRWSDR
jgi:DNA-binding XRE family transcriptional regulator